MRSRTRTRDREREQERESPKRAIAEENGEFEFLYIRSIWCAWILIINTIRMKWNDSALFQRHTKQKFVSRMQYHLDIGSQIVRSMCIIAYCLGLFALGFKICKQNAAFAWSQPKACYPSTHVVGNFIFSLFVPYFVVMLSVNWINAYLFVYLVLFFVFVISTLDSLISICFWFLFREQYWIVHIIVSTLLPNGPRILPWCRCREIANTTNSTIYFNICILTFCKDL